LRLGLVDRMGDQEREKGVVPPRARQDADPRVPNDGLG
jgi:hypothetical protein